MTTVQDLPGRVGYWHVGVPPNGPMDDLSHRLANRMVGNPRDAAALELTGSGPTLRFTERAVIALGGAEMPVRINGQFVIARGPIDIAPGAVVEIGAIVGAGQRTYLAIRGGIDVEPYLGSRSTFTLGSYGGYHGRSLRAGDVPIGGCVGAPPSPPLVGGRADPLARARLATRRARRPARRARLPHDEGPRRFPARHVDRAFQLGAHRRAARRAQAAMGEGEWR